MTLSEHPTKHVSPGKAIRNQPAAVWAVAFAMTVSYMGVGLVNPILPSIAEKMNATETESELLFTTYLALTGVMMFFTSWVSSRIGVKKTLLIGLSFIVISATLCGLSPAVAPIIGFRAGWGIGNALFVSTALAAVVSAAVGGSVHAIILYECAIGIGMAFGPLTGGLLGSIVWRAPFFGTAALMAVGLIAIWIKLHPTDGNQIHAQPVKLSAPFKALRDPGLGTLSIASFFYNMAFLATLAFPPFAFRRLGVADPLSIGLVFFGWGSLLAISAVSLAPRVTRVLRNTTALIVSEATLAVFLIACALFVNSLPALMICVILTGVPLGVLNTVLTECSMRASTLPRAVASSTYSGCRFLGGAIAPPLCTLLAEAWDTWVPFVYGAAMILVSALIVLARRNVLSRADQLL